MTDAASAELIAQLLQEDNAYAAISHEGTWYMVLVYVVTQMYRVLF